MITIVIDQTTAKCYALTSTHKGDEHNELVLEHLNEIGVCGEHCTFNDVDELVFLDAKM